SPRSPRFPNQPALRCGALSVVELPCCRIRASAADAANRGSFSCGVSACCVEDRGAVTEVEAEESSASQPVPAVTLTPEIEVFFDGDCPLCCREIALLKRWDRRGKIMFTNIAAEDFSTEDRGKSFDELMASMHGRLPDGKWIYGVEVFRRMYAAVGLG